MESCIVVHRTLWTDRHTDSAESVSMSMSCLESVLSTLSHSPCSGDKHLTDHVRRLRAVYTLFPPFARRSDVHKFELMRESL